MTIEIADRLVKLRKKYGYSQEELADKLGLSRQAVSKWERAEASPDTDNLICLAKLYGVSLDELLATDEDIETIVEEQVKDDSKKEESKEEAQDDHAEIKDDKVVLFSKNGEKVTIGNDGITHYKKDGTVVKKNFDVKNAIIGAIEATLFTFALIAYIRRNVHIFLCVYVGSRFRCYFMASNVGRLLSNSCLSHHCWIN